jgi:SHS2 domain-containing protein
VRGHETIDHAADMGIQGWGATPAEAFEEIAAAMFELMVDGGGLTPTKTVPVSCRGSDDTELLLEFLNALLSAADIEGMVFLRAVVSALERGGGGWSVEATAHGVPVEEARERLLVEVKAATYYGASVRRREDGSWVARCVVDL